ncbi:outer membrane protein [Devosia elaeis]|jgi:hypothetical protein|uniref:Outer membrane protein beta-barrel domain-containing protein n=1 Tax=Devosia elaeis TaxID=1770058 RepID=A0A178HTY8_9HYPH|nr:porin family protein [Devosia elaeis]OAM76139.1 hypothetical protein A3840_13425 [Devosia elaeis]
MRKLTVAILAAGAAAVAGPVLAADIPYYPPVIEIPDVDYGYTGSFYLRGSAGLNLMWAHHVNHPSATPDTFAIDGYGYGYSYGVGAGYETGTGLRFDLTVDRLANEDMRTTINDTSGTLTNGVHRLSLRSTVVLANAYYDVGFGDGYSAAGGAFGYVGAGAGVAFNDVISTGSAVPDVHGQNTSFAAAAMAGLGYDFGPFVADLGYRALYINRIENNATTYPYSIDNNWVHEVRGTVRYRFN